MSSCYLGITLGCQHTGAHESGTLRECFSSGQPQLPLSVWSVPRHTHRGLSETRRFLTRPEAIYLDQLVPYSICKTLKKKVNTTSFIFWFKSSINDKSKVDDGERIYKAETVSIKKCTNPRPRPREMYVCRHVTTRVIEGACGAGSIRCVFTATGRQVNEK